MFALLRRLFGPAEAPPAREWVAEGATLLDVRSAREFAGGHLEGAMNVPHTEIAARLAEIPEGRVVVYCKSGMRSALAARQLRAAGYEVLDIQRASRFR
ncbi:MAG: rhodanese-like domain-containing protein [Myxococcota bacterium]